MNSVRVRTFLFILQHPASPGIDANFLRDRTTLDVEGISKPAPTSLFLQFLIGDLTGIGLKSYSPRLFDADLRIFRQLLAGKPLRKKPPGMLRLRRRTRTV